MLTRREVLGAGLALVSVSGALAFKEQTGLPKVAALVLDEDLSVSTTLVDYLRTRKPDLPLFTIGLDSFASIELKPLFNNAQTIAGISFGATLFCLERIAWDYGHRITRRSEHVVNANAADALENDRTLFPLAHALAGDKPESFAAAVAPASSAYRPSRADDTLHAWIMQTAVTRNGAA